MSLLSFLKKSSKSDDTLSEAPSLPANSANKLAAFVGASAESPELVDVTPPVEKRGGLNLFEKYAKKETPSGSDSFREKAPRSLNKKSPKPKANKSISGSPSILTELDNGKVVYWSISEAGLTQTTETPSISASFSKNDFSYYSDISLSRKQALDFVLSELGEECRIVNRSKESKYIFASTSNRISGIPNSVGPGASIVADLLADKVAADQDAIAGFLLKDAQSGISLAIIYFRASNGVLSSPQITVNPDNLSFTLNQFASSKKVSADVPTFLFTNAEFVAAFSTIEAYPRESYFVGVPLSVILSFAVIGALAIAGGSLVYAGSKYQALSSATATKKSLESNVSSLKKSISSHIAESLGQFASTQSIDINTVSSRASSIWQPYTKVAVTASVTEQKYTVALPLFKDSSFGGRTILMHDLINEELSSFISKQPPNECAKNSLGISGAIDAIQFEITCQAPDSPIHRYSLD